MASKRLLFPCLLAVVSLAAAAGARPVDTGVRHRIDRGGGPRLHYASTRGDGTVQIHLFGGATAVRGARYLLVGGEESFVAAVVRVEEDSTECRHRVAVVSADDINVHLAFGPLPAGDISGEVVESSAFPERVRAELPDPDSSVGFDLGGDGRLDRVLLVNRGCPQVESRPGLCVEEYTVEGGTPHLRAQSFCPLE